MEKFKHIIVIDSLRGFAALSVAIFHFTYTTLNFIESESARNFFQFGGLGVHIFFVISGVVIPLSLINGNFKYKFAGKFLLKRVVRIEPPYLATLIIALLFILFKNQFLSPDHHIDFPSWGKILAHLGYLVPFFDDMRWVNEVFWTLAIEFQYYLLVMILYPFLLSDKLWKRSVFYLFMFAMPFFIDSHRFFFHYASLFLMGMVLSLYIKEKISKLEFLIILLGATVFTNFYLGTREAVAGLIPLVLIYYFPQWKSKPTLFLGKISYSLYLIHPIFGAAVVNHLSHNAETFLEKSLVVITGVVVAIVSAFIMYWFIEKPSQKASKKIKYSENNVE
ncbi:MAG: acyltransferase [Crocinitomicaceae bacterium]